MGRKGAWGGSEYGALGTPRHTNLHFDPQATTFLSPPGGIYLISTCSNLHSQTKCNGRNVHTRVLRSNHRMSDALEITRRRCVCRNHKIPATLNSVTPLRHQPCERASHHCQIRTIDNIKALIWVENRANKFANRHFGASNCPNHCFCCYRLFLSTFSCALDPMVESATFARHQAHHPSAVTRGCIIECNIHITHSSERRNMSTASQTPKSPWMQGR